MELKALQHEPPEGINAKPIDDSCFFWQASITGPQGSAYEGGIFYLFLQIPQSYPLKPPVSLFSSNSKFFIYLLILACSFHHKNISSEYK